MNINAITSRIMKIDRKFDPFLIAGLAFLVRLIYVLQLSRTIFFGHPVVDAEFHDAWAREILEQGIGHEGVYFRAPLYPYFLALVYALSNGSFMAARMAQALLGSLTAALTYLLGLEISGQRRIALAAGIGAAWYGMLIYFDGELLVETLFIPLLLASCWTYAKARRQRKPLVCLLSGFLLGLAAITRPSALLITPIFIIDFLMRGGKAEPLFRGRRLPGASLLFVGCLLPILPVAWHNVQQGDAVLIASSGGINFYIGNHAQADGLHSLLPGLGAIWDVPAASYRAYQSEGKVLKPSETSRYYSGLAWQFILGRPLDALRLFLKKFFAFWNRLEISNNRDLYFFMHETAIMPYLRLLGFWIVGPLGLLGGWIGWRRRMLPGWLLWFVPIYMLSVMAFFVTARFRAPMIPFLLICAALAIFQMAERRSRFWDRRRVADLAMLILAAVFVNTNPWRLRAENPAHANFCLGNAYLDADNLEAARSGFQAALQADSLYPQAHLNLGVIAYRRGDLRRAEEEYQRELALYPNDARAMNNLGVLRDEAGRYREAGELYNKALEHEPYYEDARINLAQCLFQQGMDQAQAGQIESALGFFSRAVAIAGGNALYRYNYALALGRLGYASAAQEQLEKALSLKPDFQAARDLLRKTKNAISGSGEPQP